MRIRIHKPTLLLTLLSLLLLILAPACGAAPAQAQEARSDKPRESAPQVPAGDLAAVSEGQRAFAFDLYQALRSEDGNLFYSPYSLSMALAMTYAGARGETEQQMADTLHFVLPQNQLHPAFNALDLALNSAEGEAFTLNTANAVWGQQGYSLRPDFLDVLAVNYGAGLQLLDFTEPGRREEARQTINNWVSRETEGKIEELLEEGILTQYTRLVLTNAIYFNAEWAEPFPAGNTQDLPFTRLDGSQVMVPTMARRSGTSYGEGAGWQAVELEYKGSRMRMLILLPASGEFEAFEQGLSAEMFDAARAALQPSDVKLYLPKFSYDASLGLAETLGAMGMPDAFDPDRADFSGIADVPPQLYLSHVIHKAFVAVDELGTEAAAATGVVAEITSMPQEVRVDRPFVYAIYDAETGAVLFVGRVLDPGQ